MKIGYNFKKLQMAFKKTINFFSSKIMQNENNIANHETRISTLENNSSEWVKLNSGSGNIEINQ